MPRSTQQQADYAAKLDRFAELLSLDIPMPLIAQRLGTSRGGGAQYALRPPRQIWVAGAMTWQTMDTAPRDGSRIIGWFKDRAIVVFWRSGPKWEKNHNYGRRTNGTIWYWSDGYSRYPEPDCWQPQPDPPAGAVAAPPWKPTPPKPENRVIRSPAARRRLVEQKAEPQFIERKSPIACEPMWCDQCQQRVFSDQTAACTSPFCKAKEKAA
ncbi:MAG: hypothetical protein ACR652_17630 [Methylocystis sp.]|uniref:hypothetical protein n=1 Tax=Methylocystis sp. TaxID=1911079 RepID=UPI003DA2FD86